jgi:hypothetical protein
MPWNGLQRVNQAGGAAPRLAATGRWTSRHIARQVLTPRTQALPLAAGEHMHAAIRIDGHDHPFHDDRCR